MATSNAAMLELGSRCLGMLGANTAELDAAATEHIKLVSELPTDIQS